MFDSEDDALELLEDYGLDEARVKLLGQLGRVPEAAAIRAKNGDMMKAVEMLTASAARSVDHVRPAIEYLLTGLRQGLSFGVSPTSSLVVSRLLALAERLQKRVMKKREVDEVRPVHSISGSYASAPLACNV